MNDAGCWDRWEAKARTMSDVELHYAILDCSKTAAAMDQIDREAGGDRAGRYRDEASVYRTEQTRRMNERNARLDARVKKAGKKWTKRGPTLSEQLWGKK